MHIYERTSIRSNLLYYNKCQKTLGRIDNPKKLRITFHPDRKFLLQIKDINIFLTTEILIMLGSASQTSQLHFYDSK